MIHRARAVALLVVSMSVAAAAAAAADQASGEVQELAVAGRRIAVLPLLNRTGGAAPVEEIREQLAAHLEQRGFAVLPTATLERFMRQHRVRYTGGVDREIALALRRDTGARAALVTSLDLYQEFNPPKVAMTSRLVSATDVPRILWMDSAARTGDEAPGILGLGLITELDKVRQIVIGRLSDSLSRHAALAAGGGTADGAGRRARKRHRPKVVYASIDRGVDMRQRRSIAVLPFANDSTTRYAGEILTDQLVRHLAMAGLPVLEPGVVRRMMLDARQIQPEGPSLPQVDLLRAALTVDAVIYGEVAHYQEGRGGNVSPVLGFSLRAIDTHDRQVFWSSVSHTEGDDGVFFFDVGQIASAHHLSSELANAIVLAWVGDDAKTPAAEAETETEKTAEELAILTGDAETLARLLDAAKRARAELEKELEAARQESKLARAERDDLERRLAEIRELDTDSRRLLEAMTTERDGVARRMTDAERRESMLKDSIDALELLLDEARRRGEELESELAASEQARAELEQERNSLIAQIEALGDQAPGTLGPGPPRPSEPVVVGVASEVEGAVRAWAGAWSEQRVDDYLAAYSRSFQPRGGLGLDEWQAQRRLRLSRPEFIELGLEELRVELPTADGARARFRQSYRSNTFADVVDKTLELRREADGWKIVRELVE